MCKTWKFARILLITAFVVTTISVKSYAVPAFARQMSVECSACHFKQFPLLNAFGRTFKAGGFIMGGQSLIEGDKLSLPNVLNASLVTKVRYQKTNGDSNPKKGTDKGEFQFPDEAALLIGGKAAEHVGFLLEFATFGAANTGSGEVTSGTPDKADTGSGDFSLFASYKMPIVYDVGRSKVSVIPFSTDALGASYGFELLNTGAVRNVRLTEHRKEVSAQQYLGTDGAATGIAFVAAYDTGFVNISQWAPVHGNNDNSFLNYFRIAATPQIGDWDLGMGGQMWSGETTGTFGDTEAAGTTKKADAWAVDAQAQGEVASMSLAVNVSYAVAAKTTDTTNIFNSSTAGDKKAMAVAAELGVLSDTYVSLAYRTADNGKATNSTDDATALGLKYMLAQNVQLSLNHTIYSGDANKNNKGGAGDQLSTLMIFAAF